MYLLIIAVIGKSEDIEHGDGGAEHLDGQVAPGGHGSYRRGGRTDFTPEGVVDIRGNHQVATLHGELNVLRGHAATDREAADAIANGGER